MNDSLWKNLLGFDKMIAPTVIKIVYFLLLLSVLGGTVAFLAQGQIFGALGILVFGFLGVRLWCEMLILMFRVYEQLTTGVQYLKEIKEGKSASLQS